MKYFESDRFKYRLVAGLVPGSPALGAGGALAMPNRLCVCADRRAVQRGKRELVLRPTLRGGPDGDQDLTASMTRAGGPGAGIGRDCELRRAADAARSFHLQRFGALAPQYGLRRSPTEEKSPTKRGALRVVPIEAVSGPLRGPDT
jgi:hypothetical protein